MANKYTSMYLNDIENLAREGALECMLSPVRRITDQAGDEERVKAMNDRAAQFNEGVRTMAVWLINRLNKPEDNE